VGTLSYMSPEAFMCNETDANGNIIKSGRPSDYLVAGLYPLPNDPLFPHIDIVPSGGGDGDEK
ncbi:hypothetical protein Tco_1490093, partial [Tanacetum coccineum]